MIVIDYNISSFVVAFLMRSKTLSGQKYDCDIYDIVCQ